jgi:formate C-acetyltransferase
MLSEPRYMSLEQAKIITEVYASEKEKPVIIKRAIALRKSLENIEINIENEELIVGNRTKGVRGGVVFPESGISWIDKEIETLPSRPQDKFLVKEEDVKEFRENILPFWKGISLEDRIRETVGEKTDRIAKVVKINQKDHAQGHICPNTEKWLRYGPAGLREEAFKKLEAIDPATNDYYTATVIVLDGACSFINRYADLAAERAASAADEKMKADLLEVSRICRKLAKQPPETFHEAVQSVWFLYTILHMESNASSFSPGRMDQYLYPYYRSDLEQRKLDDRRALEIIECLWLKFNQIVYLRNSHSAKYFAGFPIGFNVAVGGRREDGSDASNELSYLFLKAQEHIGLPQPNLSARLHKNSPDEFLKACVKVISKGSGMPQCFNDEAVIPALRNQGTLPIYRGDVDRHPG